MNGHDYRKLIAAYVAHTYAARGLDVYEEVPIGTSTLGKARRVDLLLIDRNTAGRTALAIECKYQDSSGTADEKIPYALEELRALRIASVVVYAGVGFSSGVLHLLQSSPLAAFCLPDQTLRPVARPRSESIHSGTWQLDHTIAQIFGFWDIILGERKPISPSPSSPGPASPSPVSPAIPLPARPPPAVPQLSVTEALASLPIATPSSTNPTATPPGEDLSELSEERAGVPAS